MRKFSVTRKKHVDTVDVDVAIEEKEEGESLRFPCVWLSPDLGRPLRHVEESALVSSKCHQ